MTHKKQINDLSLFLILFLSSSFTICNDIWSSAATIGLWCLTAAVLILELDHVEIRQFCLGCALAGCMVISSVINGENARSWIVMVYSYFVIVLYTSYVSFGEFVDSYQRIMKMLCMISLVGYFSFTMFPSLHRAFSFLRAKSATNFVLYAASRHHSRNMGMFWEPGAFQTFVNLALLFEMSKDRVNYKTVILYAATIVTTYSTTGYISMALIFLMPFFKREEKFERKLFLLVVMLICVLVCYFSPTINTLLFASSYEGKSTVFGKVSNFLNSSNDSSVLTSADIRYNAVFEVAKAFLEKPIWGYGYKGLAKRTYAFTHGMNTCTFLNWFATYGIIYGVVATIGMIRFSRKIVSGTLCVLLTIVILFMITMSENYVAHPSIILLLFLGYTPSQHGSSARNKATGIRFSLQ